MTSVLRDSICPNCHGTEWKTARMVVLEGTTFTGGDLKGAITEPGRMGDLKMFFLADRWFSLDKSMDARFEFTTTSALVVKVHELMLDRGRSLSVPPEPAKPTIDEPNRPVFAGYPTAPDAPKLAPIPADRTWLDNFTRTFLWLSVLPALFVIFGGGLTYVKESRGFLAVVVGCIVVTSVFHAFVANKGKRRAAEDYNRALLDKYEKKLAKFKVDWLKADEERLRQTSSQERYSKELAEYSTALSDYDARREQWIREQSRVLAAREKLWDNARVCLRCSTAYCVSA